MALEHETSAVEAKLSGLCLGATKNQEPALGAPVPPTVTVTELSTAQLSPAAKDTFNLAWQSMPEPALEQRKPDTFHAFPFLPAELRLKIWHHSFVPRAVELHTRRTHYADDIRGAPRWQSLSRNPAALSVNAEARAAAREFYTVTLPLCDPFDLPLRPTQRLLYVNPEEDTVVLLGDLHFPRLTKLLEWFREQDAAYFSVRSRKSAAGRGKGLKKLAVSVAPWAHAVGAATLRAFARTVFADMEEFVLFTFQEPTPPAVWTGGRCVLEDVRADGDSYRHFVVCWGSRFREGSRWMTVGKRPLKVVDIYFQEGW